MNILLTQLIYGISTPILKQIELGKIRSLDHLLSLSPETKKNDEDMEIPDTIGQYEHNSSSTGILEGLKN